MTSATYYIRRCGGGERRVTRLVSIEFLGAVSLLSSSSANLFLTFLSVVFFNKQSLIVITSHLDLYAVDAAQDDEETTPIVA